MKYKALYESKAIAVCWVFNDGHCSVTQPNLHLEAPPSTQSTPLGEPVCAPDHSIPGVHTSHPCLHSLLSLGGLALPQLPLAPECSFLQVVTVCPVVLLRPVGGKNCSGGVNHKSGDPLPIRQQVCGFNLQNECQRCPFLSVTLLLLLPSCVWKKPSVSCSTEQPERAL